MLGGLENNIFIFFRHLSGANIPIGLQKLRWYIMVSWICVDCKEFIPNEKVNRILETEPDLGNLTRFRKLN